MRTRSTFWTTAVPLAVIAAAIAGCQADQETAEQGATFDAPPEVEEAPAMPIPPQPITPGAVADPGTAGRDTLADTAAVPPAPR